MPDGDGAAGQGMLTARVIAGASGPVILLSGEADLTTVAQMSALITAQLAGGTRQLTIDLSELWFADSASIRTLVLAARRLRDGGGGLVLLRPQRSVARVLALTGAEQMFTIREENPRRAGVGERGRVTRPVL
jgi:anti-sigma B factor antagonist